MHAVQIRTREAVRISFIEIAPPANMPVGRCEQGLALGQNVKVQLGFTQTPRFNRKGRMLNHMRTRAGERVRIGSHSVVVTTVTILARRKKLVNEGGGVWASSAKA